MYQPEFPLKMSARDGAYKNIDELTQTIKQNVLFLLNISPGEWPARPTLGVGIRRYLFENPSAQEWDSLHQRIKEQFHKYMPFLDVRSKVITEDSLGNSLIDESTIKLIVSYTIRPISVEEILTLNVVQKPMTQ